MVKLSVASLNCRGLNKLMKRKNLFESFKKYDIVFLQETYITNDKYDFWKNEWSGQMLYSPGTNNSKGLITLIKNNTFDNPVSIFYSSDRILGVKGLIDNEEYFFINIYGSSTRTEQNNFMNEIYNITSKCLHKNTIIGGDFNIVLDNQMDIISGDKHNSFVVENFKRWVLKRDLIDCWREINTETKDFTWARFSPFCARRLDYIFINPELSQILVKSQHVTVACTDHKLVNILLDSDHFERGKSYWKFNAALLEDQKYIDLINSELDDFENMQFDSATERFEFLKIRIKNITFEYSLVRNREKNKKIKILQKELQTFNNLASNDPNNIAYSQKLFSLKKELEIFELEKAKGAMIRSKTKDILEGEKNTAYFLGAEKSRGAYNTINRLTVDSEEITGQDNILRELVKHFENIGKINDSVDKDNLSSIQDFLKDIDSPKLSNEDKEILDRPLCIEELGKALASIDNDASPGLDGLPSSWYKFFYLRIKYYLFDSLNESIRDGHLSTTQKMGVISLLHKGKDLRKDVIKNWRPITITNCDYKILSKCLAIRIQLVLGKIIHHNQSGFMKGRNISEHIRIIDDMINLSNKSNLPGMIVALDFEKAFDSLSKQSILAALKYFNFGDDFIQMVYTLINDSESCIQNGGVLSSFFPTYRGVRQGCALSPLLFVLTLELLSIKIREEPEIEGLSFDKFNMQTVPTKILQYCDDTTLVLKSEESLKKALEIIEFFFKVSGLKLNKSKSIAIGIGSLKDSHGSPCNLLWKSKKDLIKILGIYFNANKEASDIEDNWIPKINKMNEIATKLKRRKVSLFGRITLCKTFLMSQISFNLQSLSIPEKFSTQIDTICFKYIWSSNSNNKKVIERIKRSTMCISKDRGGASMLRCYSQNQLFLTKWILKCQPSSNSSAFFATKIPHLYFSFFGGMDYFVAFTCKANDILLPHILSRFWKDAIKAWLTVKHNIDIMHGNKDHLVSKIVVETPENIPIFGNTSIAYKKKVLFHRQMISNKVLYLHQLFDDKGIFKEINCYDNFSRNIPSFIFIYNALKTAVLNALQKSEGRITTLSLNLKLLSKLKNSELRRIIDFQDNIKIYGQEFWSRKFGGDIAKNYQCSLKDIKETKLKVLLFKIYHNILPTRILLKKWNMSDSINCDCGEIDYIDHALSECSLLDHLWKEVSSLIFQHTNKCIRLNKKMKLFGLDKEDQVNLHLSGNDLVLINNIIILAKFSINKAKASGITNIPLCFENEWHYRENIFDKVK